MKLVSIPKYEDYKLDAMFNCYKWDPQFLDNNTVAKYALVLTENEHKELELLTEKIDKETRIAEKVLNNNLKINKTISIAK